MGYNGYCSSYQAPTLMLIIQECAAGKSSAAGVLKDLHLVALCSRSYLISPIVVILDFIQIVERIAERLHYGKPTSTVRHNGENQHKRRPSPPQPHFALGDIYYYFPGPRLRSMDDTSGRIGI